MQDLSHKMQACLQGTRRMSAPNAQIPIVTKCHIKHIHALGTHMAGRQMPHLDQEKRAVLLGVLLKVSHVARDARMGQASQRSRLPLKQLQLLPVGQALQGQRLDRNLIPALPVKGLQVPHHLLAVTEIGKML